MIGKTLGHYQILSQLGKGGMGEVYRAKDQKLGRDVAIKVLPEEFAKDADRVARFQREAKLLASLNHPNIAAIYGLEESGGTNFLVLELVEGETLADRLKRGPIPVEESLKLALQIAEALEAAHEKGVIHRDLKPANLKCTPEGKVKVLDFGLAKALAGEQSNVTLTNSPTLSDMATQQGVILGTAAYMSPEQAKGNTVDKRADIFAFGVVLFEMFTGPQLFKGETVSETLAAVLMREPEWKRLPPNLHPRIRLLLERCLEKESNNRYHDIADVRVDIQKALADPNGVLVQPVITVATKRDLRLGLPCIAAIVVIGAIITGMTVWKLRPPEPRQVIRFDYDLPADQQFSNVISPILSVSPDGKQFVYATNKGLYLRSMDELGARRISNVDDNPLMPFFSPDGKWVGYWSVAANKLKKIAISGAGTVDLCEARDLLQASWAADDSIVYTDRKGIMRISAKGGTPETLIESNKDETIYYPRLLPDGKSVVFTLGPAPYRIAVQPLKSKERKVLFPGDCSWYLPTGHIVYALANNLFAVPFDLKTFKYGESVQVMGGVFRASVLYQPQYAISDSGTLVYIPEGANAPTGRNLVWVDRKGKEEVLKAEIKAYNDPRISPDGNRVALSIAMAGKSNIGIWDLVREAWTALTSDVTMDSSPLWTRDGKRIFFASDSKSGGNLRVCWKAADGTGEIEQLGGTLATGHYYPYDWSHDGNELILMQFINSYDIGAVSMEGGHRWRPLLKEKYNEVRPRVSPNGKWMAYVSDESGQNEVYVRPFPGVESGGRSQISNGGGNRPLWSPDSLELFYRKGNETMAVPLKAVPEFNFESPKPLFRGQYAPGWDISPDGKRFLMIKEVGPIVSTGGGQRKFTIVLNWFEELKQRVPVK